MCGIVGIAGNLLPLDKSIFLELLHADVVRGKHATGMIQVKGNFNSVDHFKLAYPAPLFLELPAVQQELLGFLNNTVAVGHNRHATKGASGEHKNAHPFKHGNITLVHNGSLTSWLNITPTGESYTVDSEAICRAMEFEGAESVIPKLRGAFALVWVDSEDGTLNFVRNDERPLAIALNTNTNKMWWASELDMLKWSLNRDTFTRNPVSYTEIFELPVGQWLKIPVTDRGINLALAERKEVDVSQSVFQVSHNQNTRWDARRGRYLLQGEQMLSYVEANGTPTYALLEKQAQEKGDVSKDTPYSFNPAREKALHLLAKRDLENKGVGSAVFRNFIEAVESDKTAGKLDERISVCIDTFTPYSSASTGYGVVSGWMTEHPFCEVEINSQTRGEFDKLIDDNDGLISSYLVNLRTPSSKAMPYMITKGAAILSEFTLILRPNTIRATPTSTEKPTTEIQDNVTAITSLCLNDGSYITVGGSATFEGVHPEVPSGFQYFIKSISIKNTITIFTTFVNGKSIILNYNDWSKGTKNVLGAVKSKADKSQDTLVVGPDNTLILYTEWLDLVDDGCSQCGEPMNDHEKAEGLVWLNDKNYICEPCHFDIANVGY
jgi:predicted glutamine amidotransferase